VTPLENGIENVKSTKEGDSVTAGLDTTRHETEIVALQGTAIMQGKV
jgi:hypothetical protein